MANEFIARKGLISLRSSSFNETLHVQGNIDSPVEALLTASWANSSSYTITSSYSDTSLNGGVGNLTGRYTFSTSTSAGDPGNGQIRYNSTISGSVTAIYISQTTSPGTDASNYFGVLSIGDIIYIQQQNEASIWIKGYVSSSPIDNGAWWTIPFQFEKGGSGGMPDNKKDTILITAVIKEEFGAYSGSFIGNLTGTASYSETASYALQAGSSSYSNTASFAQNFNPSATASYALQSLNSISASYVDTASWSINSTTASYVTLAQTASFVATASWARNSITASFVTLAQTASFVTLAQTASFVTTASWAINSITASFVTLAQTASYVLNSVTASYVLNAVTASYVVSASFATNAETASYVPATAVSNLGAIGAVKTGSFTCTTANTWYELTMERDPETSSYWTHTTNTGQFTCSVSGYYSFYASAFLQKTGGSAAVGGIRVLKDNVQITGSYTSYTFASNNVGQILTTALTNYVASGSNYLLQVAADTNGSIQVATQPVIGTGTYNHSARVVINRV